MAQTPLAPSPLPAAPVRPGRARRVLRALAVVSCVPYLSLKIAWVAGSRIGIPEGSALLEKRALYAVANSVTILMDATVIVLALLLTQAWGRRVASWLLAFPMWVATGLLAPIMLGFPLQLVAAAFAGGPDAQDGTREPFLDDWVFDVVYGGFIMQGIALGTLFVLYARERWGGLWQGRVWELPPVVSGPRTKAVAVAAALLALFPAALHLMWALGSTTGLPAKAAEQRDTDMYLLEGTRVFFVAAAVTGVLMLVLRLGRALKVKAVLGTAWVGSGAVGCWGGWMLMASLLPEDDPAKRATGLLVLTYSVEMITGFLLAGCVVSFLRRRSA
ncbi:hypothetical protein GCM10020367_13950 [Streptomyces sannanensis]|uniref:Aromatic ring-opening dioxygenase LigA n=1 Tax=Streptomyces sannanensis TaxID=285536 RepID=A0ABP6S7D8_9ACTN